MSYTYTHFIKQNIAPEGAKKIGIYDSNGNSLFGINLGSLAPQNGKKSYSFGLVSDLHLYKTEPTWNASMKFSNTLSYLKRIGCEMCVHCGDSTQTGFYDGTDKTFDPAQFEKYKLICEEYKIPVYGICGNHESYVNPITNNLTELKTYTGTNLYYTIALGNDLFVFVGQATGSIPMNDEALQWLYETLETNRNKRCFIFVHPDISSGNPLGAYTSNRLFDVWGVKKTTVFKNLLKHYKNTIIFHGHSHFLLECQELDDSANYSDKDGFKSVHVPSLSRPCAIIDNVRTTQDDKSQGYIVDVYNDCIVLNGIDFINEKPVPLGTYKIYTTLQTIPANTFSDSTGTIVTGETT